MLFIAGDEAEEAWRIIDPVTNAWSAGDVPIQEYPAGGVPPGPVFAAASDAPDHPQRSAHRG